MEPPHYLCRPLASASLHLFFFSPFYLMSLSFLKQEELKKCRVPKTEVPTYTNL